MAHYLTMPKKSQVLALLELGWSYRRIEAETGVRRETVRRSTDKSRQGKAGQNVPRLGSRRPASRPPPTAPPHPRETRRGADRPADLAGPRRRVWYAASYESVKRYVRTIAPARRAVGVFHCAPHADPRLRKRCAQQRDDPAQHVERPARRRGVLRAQHGRAEIPFTLVIEVTNASSGK